MNNTKHAFFITIFRILVKGQKHYAVPSVDALIELLERRHATAIKRRWAFQCLRDLEVLGYIRRHVRYVRRNDSAYKQIPSMISITLKGARALYSWGVAGGETLIKQILGWIHRGEKKWPQYQNELNKTSDERSPGGLVKLGDLFSNLLPST